MSPLFVLNSKTVCCSSEKSFRSHKFFGIPAFLSIWTQQWLYDLEIYVFTPRTTEGLICNYYRRFKLSQMLQKEKPFCHCYWINLMNPSQNKPLNLSELILNYHQAHLLNCKLLLLSIMSNFQINQKIVLSEFSHFLFHGFESFTVILLDKDIFI